MCLMDRKVVIITFFNTGRNSLEETKVPVTPMAASLDSWFKGDDRGTHGDTTSSNGRRQACNAAHTPRLLSAVSYLENHRKHSKLGQPVIPVAQFISPFS